MWNCGKFHCYCLTGVVCPSLNSTLSTFTLNTTANNHGTTIRATCATGYAIDPRNSSNNTINTYCTQNGTWSTYPIPCQSMSQSEYLCDYAATSSNQNRHNSELRMNSEEICDAALVLPFVSTKHAMYTTEPNEKP